MKKKIGYILAVSILVVCFSFLLDLFDIPSWIGLNIGAINWDAMTLIIGNTLVILIAITTYFLIDQRNCEKAINQRSNALYLLRTIYSGLRDAINTSQEPKFSCMLIAMNSEQRENLQKTFLNLCTFMQESVRKFYEDGVITSEEVKTYINICTHYVYNMNLFFMLTPEFKILSPDTMRNNNKKLLTLINDAVEKLDKSE